MVELACQALLAQIAHDETAKAKDYSYAVNVRG
jgi:hypothetical protein